MFPSVQLFPYILTSTNDLYSTTMTRFFTLRMWFKRLQPSLQKINDQVLFEHEGVIKIQLK